MKKIRVIFFTMLLLNQGVLAQEYEYVPFPTKNTVWSSFEVFPSKPYPYDQMLKIYASFDEDTILYNWTWQKVYELYDSIPNKNNGAVCGYITEQEKVVYYLDIYGGGGLLYNFNATIGDTLITDFDLHQSSFIVSQIDTLLIGNKKRKRIKFIDGEYLDDLSWIEGIGSTNGLLRSGVFVVGTHNTLLCVKEENETVYYNNRFGECYPDYPTHVTGIKKETEVKELTIFPNPASKDITLELPENSSGTLCIYSIDGRVMFDKMTTISRTQTVSVAQFNNGIYIIQLTGYTSNTIYRNYLVINK